MDFSRKNQDFVSEYGVIVHTMLLDAKSVTKFNVMENQHDEHVNPA